VDQGAVAAIIGAAGAAIVLAVKSAISWRTSDDERILGGYRGQIKDLKEQALSRDSELKCLRAEIDRLRAELIDVKWELTALKKVRP